MYFHLSFAVSKSSSFHIVHRKQPNILVTSLVFQSRFYSYFKKAGNLKQTFILTKMSDLVMKIVIDVDKYNSPTHRESELSFLTGTFLHHYDIINRKLQRQILQSRLLLDRQYCILTSLFSLNVCKENQFTRPSLQNASV